MGFSKMIALLQIKDKGHIIFVNTGNFYVARGKDALCLNEYRLKIRDKGKRRLKKKIKKLKQEIKEGKITSKEAKKYLAGHLGYIKIANVKNLTDKLFYSENSFM